MSKDTPMEDADATKPTPKPVKNENIMPSASADDASKYPDMKLAQSIHRLSMVSSGKLKVGDLSSKILPDDLAAATMKRILSDQNTSLYKHVRDSMLKGAGDVSTASDDELAKLDEINTKTMEELEAKVIDSRENAGEMEVLSDRFDVARFAAKSLTKNVTYDSYQKVMDLPKLSSGKVIDSLMECSRVSSFYGDSKKNKELIEKAVKLAEDGGDWDRRNRLKVYNALSKILARDTKGAATLLIDCISTFSCNELCSYTDFVLYAVICNVLHLPRTDLKTKIIDGPDVRSTVADLPVVSSLVNALYECDYKSYLSSMVDIQPILVADRFLQPHAGYIMRELYVLGYKQFLDSYKSVTLESMASSFGVSPQYLDLQLSRFIAAGRLTAKIDKFGGVVETNRPDKKNAQYRDMIQKGDLLLNRIQKLARVVDL